MKIFKCKHCGNIITKLDDKGPKVVCCGEVMEELVANTVDAALEKHVPVVERTGKDILVKVGSVEHPMIDVHYIQFIIVETNKGFKVEYLKPNDKPVAKFTLSDNEELIFVYEYCNIHGLWKSNNF